MGVARPSVTGALRQLAQKGLINYEPYGLVSLTKAGQAKAAGVAKKHDIIKSFFIEMLGVDAESATDAACRAEHTLGKPIVGKLMSFVEFVTRQRQVVIISWPIFTSSTQKENAARIQKSGKARSRANRRHALAVYYQTSRYRLFGRLSG